MQRTGRIRGDCLRVIVVSAAALTSAPVIDDFPAFADTLSDVAEARHLAAKRTRRIIMNNDGGDCLTVDDDLPENLSEMDRFYVDSLKKVDLRPHAPETFLARRTTPVLDTHVDTIFYGDGVFNNYTHKSDETELQGEVSFYRRMWADEMLAKFGKDPLTCMIECCRQNKIEIFWSMRTNDTHDSDPHSANMISEWKKQNSHLLMAPQRARFRYGNSRWSAVNYSEAEVRDKVFRIIEDVVTRYDVDGVELDFFRHPILFKPQMTGDPVTLEHCDMLTDLLRRVREMADGVAGQRGKPVLIAVRIPDSVAYSKKLGIDIETWLEKDLVDLVIGGGYMHLEPWENLAALGKKYDAPVYACLSVSRLRGDLGAGEKDNAAIRLWRGEALRAWESGVDGIYTFNLFDPNSRLFRELGDPELLRTLPRRYERVASHPTLGRWQKNGKQYVIKDSE